MTRQISGNINKKAQLEDFINVDRHNAVSGYPEDNDIQQCLYSACGTEKMKTDLLRKTKKNLLMRLQLRDNVLILLLNISINATFWKSYTSH